MLREYGERIWSAAASGIPRDAAFKAPGGTSVCSFGRRFTPPCSARSAEGKRCRDPRTARLLSPHSKLRFAPNRCGVDLNESQCLRAFAQNPHDYRIISSLVLGAAWCCAESDVA
jgi:hypothetical protein